MTNFNAILMRFSSVMSLENKKVPEPTGGIVGLEVKDASFGWTQGEEVVKNLNFELGEGELMVVIGTVGSGKTSLLYSIMDETKLTSGSKRQNGTIAYVEQEPFIFSAPIKANIVFGRKFD